jgi:hypothetical protein
VNVAMGIATEEARKCRYSKRRKKGMIEKKDWETK